MHHIVCVPWYIRFAWWKDSMRASTIHYPDAIRFVSPIFEGVLQRQHTKAVVDRGLSFQQYHYLLVTLCTYHIISYHTRNMYDMIVQTTSRLTPVMRCVASCCIFQYFSAWCFHSNTPVIDYLVFWSVSVPTLFVRGLRFETRNVRNHLFID